MMNDAPVFSIVMPTKDRPQFIAEAIDGIRDQSFGGWELIIVADGDIVPVRDHVKWLGDSRIRVVDGPGRGIIPAVNLGFSLSRGTILGWANDDDIMADGTLEEVASVFLANREARWTYGKCWIIDGDGVVTGEFGGEPMVIEEQLIRNRVPQPSVFWFRDVMSEIGEFNNDPAMDLAADWEYWNRIAVKYDPVVTDKKRAYYRQHAGSISVSRLAEQNAHADVVRETCQRLR